MNRNNWTAALCALGIGVVPWVANAGVGKGDIEAGVSLSISKSEIEVDTGVGTTTTDTESGTISGSIGYFVTDIIEAKLAASAIVMDIGTFGILTPGADFVFLGKSGKTAPFVGASYGLSFGDKIGPDTDYFEGHGGIKVFFRERTSFELKLTRYEPTKSTAGARTELSAGLNVYF